MSIYIYIYIYISVYIERELNIGDRAHVDLSWKRVYSEFTSLGNFSLMIASERKLISPSGVSTQS